MQSVDATETHHPADAGDRPAALSVDVLRFRCDYCRRWADAGLAACAEKYGARITLGELLGIFIAGCVWRPDHRKPQKYGRKCGAYILDMRRTDPPTCRLR